MKTKTIDTDIQTRGKDKNTDMHYMSKKFRHRAKKRIIGIQTYKARQWIKIHTHRGRSEGWYL